MTGYSMGWQREVPDFRDYTLKNAEIAKMFRRSKAVTPPKAGISSKCDLTKWCSPIEDQESIGSCTAHAGVGLIEYYQRRAFNDHIDASRLFLYKVTRNLLHWTGDTGAWLRTTMKAMALFGIPPEEYWPYDTQDYDVEPSAFCYAFGQNYQSVRYFRLDEEGMTNKQLLKRVKNLLNAGYPSMFGFTVYNFGNEKGEFEFPSISDPVLGGHAVMAMGYNDNQKIGSTKGALKIRNSWGESWGEDGYGWLPYKYVEAGLAVDFWSLFRNEYVAEKKFE